MPVTHALEVYAQLAARSTQAPLPVRMGVERPMQVGGPRVGPEHIRKAELGEPRLEEQNVRHPLFAPCADKESHVGPIAGREAPAKGVLVELGGPTTPNVLGEGGGGVHKVTAAAVAEGARQGHRGGRTRRARCRLHEVGHRDPRRLRELFDGPDDTDPESDVREARAPL